MQRKVQKAGAAQQQPIPLLQIVLVEFPDCGLGRIDGNGVKVLPGQTANPAMIKSLALEGEPLEVRKFLSFRKVSMSPFIIRVSISEMTAASLQSLACLLS